MCQLLLWLSSPMPRWEIRWIWSINHLLVSISIQVTLPCESPKLHVRRLEWRCRGCFSISASKESRLAGPDTRYPGTCLFVLRHDLKSSFHLGKMKLSLFNDWPKCLITSKKFVLIVKIKLKRKSLLPVSKLLLVKMRVTLRQVLAK